MYRRISLQILPKWYFLNSKVCFSHVRLKEKFHKNLEVIRNNNEAQKLCGILLKAKEAIQEPEAKEVILKAKKVIQAKDAIREIFLDETEIRAHSIICELKEFIHKDKPDCTPIDTILKTLKNTTNETRQQLISLLFSIHADNLLTDKNQSSKEHLKCFIKDVECFVQKEDKNNHGYIWSYRGELSTVQARLFSHSEKDVIDLMYTVRKAIFDEGHHTDDNHPEIEALVSDAASLISTRLLQLNSASESVIMKCLKARSGDCHSTYEWFRLFGYCYFILDEVSFYRKTKKERLLQYLKDTKSSNNAREFIELLKSINRLNSDTDSDTDSSTYLDDESLNSDFIMNRLKDIIHTEKPEYNINKFILMSLQIKTPHLKEINELISQFFLDVDKFDCEKQNSEKFLMHFVQEFERLIKLYDNDFYKSESSLERISVSLSDIARFCTADLLEAILRKYQWRVFDEEKKKIGYLMVAAIKPIKEYVSYRMPVPLESSLLLQRSALEYLKDFFDSFPVDETPLKRLDKHRIDMCIEKLDEDIKYMCKDANLAKGDDEKTDDFDDHEVDEDVTSTFPESHYWWAKCSKIPNRIRKF